MNKKKRKRKKEIVKKLFPILNKLSSFVEPKITVINIIILRKETNKNPNKLRVSIRRS